MSQKNYAISDGDGNQITTGLPAHTARRTAQRFADERGVSVWLYPVPARLDDDGEPIDESEEIAPETVRACIYEKGNGLPDVGDYVAGDDGELYRVVSIGRIHTSPSGSGLGDYAHAVIEHADWSDCPEGEEHTALAVLSEDDDLVVVETMPDHLRESHRAARNWGVYPLNGAERSQVTREEAEEIVAADPDGYARIV